MNGLFKFSPIGKTETTAFVRDAEADYYTGRHSDPYFTVELDFFDEDGNDYRVIKEVTWSMYDQYKDGSPIEISYATLNPYNVVVRDYSIWNLFETISYKKFIFYSVFLVGFLIYLAGRVSARKKNKQ